jgi:hypothetical protein
VQQRWGAEKLTVALIDVDPGYFAKPEQYQPQARKILARLKVDWPNAIAPHGFTDTARVFNLSGYGNIIVDARGIVRGVNLHGGELERLIQMVVEGKTPEKTVP